MDVNPSSALFKLARTNFLMYVCAVCRTRYHLSGFAVKVAKAVDTFVEDLIGGKRPILLLQAPPQHGKSWLISMALPAYLYGRLHAAGFDHKRIASASYALPLARRNAREVKEILMSPQHQAIFPEMSLLMFRGLNTSTEFKLPHGGSYQAVGAGGGLTGYSLEAALIDDPTKNAKEAMSLAVQDGLWDWYQTVITSRLQAHSGVIVIGTPWSKLDLLARINDHLRDDPRFRRLSFPALNEPDEIGYTPELPPGPLVEALHDRKKLLEIKSVMSEAWWSALYQQQPLAELGSVFGRSGVQYYKRSELPTRFQNVVISVDAAFKDGSTSDYVCVGVWGADGQRVWLLDWRREKLSFIKTAAAVLDLKQKYPHVSRVYIEEAANGAALLDMLKKHVTGLVGVPPEGSKEARAYAVSWVWENHNVLLPHPDEAPGIKPIVEEIVSFPDVAHDDAVDCMTIALQQLCLRSPISKMITADVLRVAGLRGST